MTVQLVYTVLACYDVPLMTWTQVTALSNLQNYLVHTLDCDIIGVVVVPLGQIIIGILIAYPKWT